MTTRGWGANLTDGASRRLELNYKFLPEAAWSGISLSKHQLSRSRVGKDKDSSFVLTELITRWGRESPLSGRIGLEERSPSGESSTSSPYAEATFRYDYSEQSFLSGGYTYSLEETDVSAALHGLENNRFFCNVQHALTAAIITSLR